MVQTSDARTGTPGPELIAAAQNGEEWAWQAIYVDLVGPVTGYVRTRGARDAEDLAGEVFLQVARDIGRFEGDESSFRSWVFVIAHRRLIDDRRAASRQVKTSSMENGAVELPGGNVEDEAIAQLAQAWVRELLEALTPSQRDVLALRVIADLSLEETAAVMGKRVGAVKALQRRALNSARRLIETKRVTP